MASCYWTEKRQKIYDWMVSNNLEAYAHIFKGAVQILYEELPGYVRFVSHAARDLMNGMPSDFIGVKRKLVQYSNITDDIYSDWIENDLPIEPILKNSLQEESTIDDTSKSLFIPNNVINKIQNLLKEHQEGRGRNKKKPYLFFGAFLPKSEENKNPPEAFTKTWKELHSWFKKRAHQGKDLSQNKHLENISYNA